MELYTLEQIRKELNTELSMRRKVWQKIPGKKEKFVSQEHQKRYDVLRFTLELMQDMKNTELYMHKKRMEAKKQKPLKLF